MDLERILGHVEMVHECTIGLLDDGVRKGVEYGLRKANLASSRDALSDMLIGMGGVSVILGVGAGGMRVLIDDFMQGTSSFTDELKAIGHFVRAYASVVLVQLPVITDLEMYHHCRHIKNAQRSEGVMHPYERVTRLVRPYFAAACAYATMRLFHTPANEVVGSMALVGTSAWPWALSFYTRDTKPGALSKARSALKQVFTRAQPITVTT
jgi:hypothetical protein